MTCYDQGLGWGPGWGGWHRWVFSSNTRFDQSRFPGPSQKQVSFRFRRYSRSYCRSTRGTPPFAISHSGLSTSSAWSRGFPDPFPSWTSTLPELPPPPRTPPPRSPSTHPGIPFLVLYPRAFSVRATHPETPVYDPQSYPTRHMCLGVPGLIAEKPLDPNYPPRSELPFSNSPPRSRPPFSIRITCLELPSSDLTTLLDPNYLSRIPCLGSDYYPPRSKLPVSNSLPRF